MSLYVLQSQSEVTFKTEHLKTKTVPKNKKMSVYTRYNSQTIYTEASTCNKFLLHQATHVNSSSNVWQVWKEVQAIFVYLKMLCLYSFLSIVLLFIFIMLFIYICNAISLSGVTIWNRYICLLKQYAILRHFWNTLSRSSIDVTSL